jgi:hypothetical protein
MPFIGRGTAFMFDGRLFHLDWIATPKMWDYTATQIFKEGYGPW